MGLLEQLRSGAPRSTYAPWDNFWFSDVPRGGTVEGIAVSAETALRLSAVWACIGIRSEGMASLPLLLYRRLERGKERATKHALYKTLRWQPNTWQTAFEFEELSEVHLGLRGNFYARIREDARTGQIQSLTPLHPDRVTPGLLPNGRTQFEYRPPSGQAVTLTQNEVHHRRWRSIDGVKGLSPIEYAASVLSVAMAGDRHAGKFFNGGTNLSNAIIHPSTLGPEATQNLRDSVAKYRGEDKFLILEEDVEVKALGVSARDAQLIESRQYSIEEIARFYNVPLHMLKVNKAGTVSYASVEMFDLDFVMHTMRTAAVRNEQAIWRDLLSERDQDDYVPEYLLEAMLRGDSAARAAFYRSGIESRWLLPNEARERENLNPIPGGDEFADVKPPAPRPTPEEDPRDPRGRPRGHGDARARLIALEATARVVQKEIASAGKAATKFAKDPAGWKTWCEEFYREHAEFVGYVLKVPSNDARRYAAEQCRELRTKGVPAMADWETRVVPHLAALALGEDHGTNDTHV